MATWIIEASTVEVLGDFDEDGQRVRVVAIRPSEVVKGAPPEAGGFVVGLTWRSGTVPVFSQAGEGVVAFLAPISATNQETSDGRHQAWVERVVKSADEASQRGQGEYVPARWGWGYLIEEEGEVFVSEAGERSPRAVVMAQVERALNAATHPLLSGTTTPSTPKPPERDVRTATAGPTLTATGPILTRDDALRRSVPFFPANHEVAATAVRLITHATLETRWFGFASANVADEFWSPSDPVWLVGMVSTDALTSDDAAMTFGLEVPLATSIEGMFIAWDANSGTVRSRGSMSTNYAPRTMGTLLELQDDSVLAPIERESP